MLVTDLSDGWTVRAVTGDVPLGVAAATVPATVPGCVHTDLLQAGLLPDPYLDLNEALVQWVGRADWRYETTFPGAGAQRGERTDLVFGGLDTVARVELNGVLVAETRNMHRTYRFDVGPLLQDGENELAVTFRSPVKAADQFSEELGRRPHVNHHPYNAIRKMACNFGWDWGPDLATVGIWKPVSLESWSVARLASVRPLTTIADGVGTVRVHVDVERVPDAEGDLPVSVTVADVRASGRIQAGATSTVVEVAVERPALWWPAGYGAQPLYDLHVVLGDELDRWDGRIGFRTVELRHRGPTTRARRSCSSSTGSGLRQGRQLDPRRLLPDRVTRERYADADPARRRTPASTCCGSGAAGIFERTTSTTSATSWASWSGRTSSFACAAYPEEEPMRAEIEAEARDNITRLMPHPSLVLWNGNNENLWGYEDWGWDRADRRPARGAHGYYDDLLPAVWPSSTRPGPYSARQPLLAASTGAPPNDPDHGTMHIWDVWNQLDYAAYREHRARGSSPSSATRARRPGRR